MAQDIGLLLRGLGAAVTNQVPQFRQELAQRQQQQELERQRARQTQMQDFEMMQQLQNTTFQDAQAVLELLKPGVMNIEGALSLLEDRQDLIGRIGISIPNDPIPMIYENLRRAEVGDTNALNTARNMSGALTFQGVSRGVLKLPEEKVYRPGDVVYQGGKQAFEIPAAPTQQSATFRMLTPQEVQQQGLEPGNYQINERTRQVSRVGAPSTVVNVGQATEGEREASILANRLDFAQAQIQDILATAPEAEKPAAGATALNTLGLEYLARAANPTERQIIEAAQMDMLDAALTLGTGAAYTREQLEGYRASYFPQLGDDPRTITAKSQRLNNLVNAAYAKAGRAAPTERRGAQAQAPQDWIDAGLNQADWNALSQDDKKAYLEAQ